MILKKTRPDGVKVEREVLETNKIALFKSMGWKEESSTKKVSKTKYKKKSGHSKSD